MSRESSFRGYHGISTVVSNMQTLADGLSHRRPPAGSITLRAKDYDLIVRWPKAAELHGIVISQGAPYWRGYGLRREHGRPLKQGGVTR